MDKENDLSVSKCTELNIDGMEDRRELIKILADNGYIVTVKKENNFPSGYKYWVCIYEPTI